MATVPKFANSSANSARQVEIDVSLIMAQAFRNVESVGWSSFFEKRSKSGKKGMLNHMDLGRKTTLWIVRTGESCWSEYGTLERAGLTESRGRACKDEMRMCLQHGTAIARRDP
jgi:hypothetical protein